MPTLVGVFAQPRELAGATRQLRARGHGELETFSPVPALELDDVLDAKPSGVRLWTLIGGLAGVLTGYAMTLWMALEWEIIVGGKPFASVAPYTIIAYELTILFGGLLTALGFLAVARLPTRRPNPHYSARFSAEDFGLVVTCKERDVSEVDGLLRAHGATEVSLVEP